MNIDFAKVEEDVRARARSLAWKLGSRVDYDDMVQSGIEAALLAIPKVGIPEKAQAYVGKSACKGVLRAALIQANGSIRNYRIRVEKELISEGKCVTCRGPQDADKGRECISCKAKSVAGTKARQTRRHKAGLCIRCGVEPIHRARMCKVHYEADCEQARRLRIQRRESGMCVDCNTRSRPGLSKCQRCADKESARLKARKKSATH